MQDVFSLDLGNKATSCLEVNSIFSSTGLWFN